MAAVTNGAELVRLLRESHTPEKNLAAARDTLRAAHAGDGRVASSEDVIAALAAALGEDHGTVAKARRFAETGTDATPEAGASATPIEDQLLAGGPAKNPPADTPPVSPDAKAETGPADAKPRKK